MDGEGCWASRSLKVYQYTIFGFNDGNAILCVTYPGDTFRCQLYAWGYRNGSDPTQFTNVTNTDHLKSNFSLTGSNWAPDVYDPRKRTWYKQGTTAPGLMAWSNAFLSTVPTYPCVCVSAGIYNSTGAFIGVGSVFINLDTMEVFLGNLLAVANTVSVLIDNQGLLLASTYVDPVSVTTNWTGSSSSPVPSNCLRSDVANGAAKNVLMCRQRATTYGYAPLRQLALENPGAMSAGTNGVAEFKLASRNYFVTVVPIVTPTASNMNWRFALFLPEEEVTSGIVKGRNIAIYICVAVVLVAGVTCLVTAQCRCAAHVPCCHDGRLGRDGGNK